MSNHLASLCEHHFRIARGFYGGDIYRQIGLRGRRYEGLQLVWDAPSRLVVVGYCWDLTELRRTRDDVLHLHALLPQLHVYKKLHLVLFHTDNENAADQAWPVGISFSPITLSLTEDLHTPPGFVATKLDSILGIPAAVTEEAEAAATGGRPPNWRLFLQDDRDIVMRKIKELAGAKAELPADLQTTVDSLLTLAESDAPDLAEQVTQILNRLWEVSADAAPGTTS